MEIEAYTVTRAPPVHVYRRGPETHMEQKQYPQVFRAHHDHQYSTCSVAFSPCMQHATSTSIDIFMECPYHTQTIHTHVYKEANNNTDALTAPATPPPHCNTLFTHHSLSPLHQHCSLLLAAFPQNAQQILQKTVYLSEANGITTCQQQTQHTKPTKNHQVDKCPKRFRNPLNRNRNIP